MVWYPEKAKKPTRSTSGSSPAPSARAAQTDTTIVSPATSSREASSMTGASASICLFRFGPISAASVLIMSFYPFCPWGPAPGAPSRR